MNAVLLKSAISLILFFFLSVTSQAQKTRFIYIQTENMHPFYVKIDRKFLSSSASGYIIIPKLADSTYNFSVGFPRNEWPEYNVTVSVKETDAGFLLKNIPEKGWSLFNMQTLQLLVPKKNTEALKTVQTETGGDEFSTILASVVNDPAITQRTVVKNEIQPEEKPLENKIEEKAVVKEDDIKPLPEEKKKKANMTGKTKITKLKYAATREGVNIAYVDMVNGIVDTVHVFIPAVKSIIIKNAKKQEEKQKAIQLKDNSGNNRSRVSYNEWVNPEPKHNPGMTASATKEKILL